jgi:KUP system potassium uptake protein
MHSGEGGTFALLQGLFPKRNTDEEDRTLTGDSSRGNTQYESDVRGRPFLDAAKWPLYMWSLFGTALTLSDGIFTPGEDAPEAVEGPVLRTQCIQ